MKKFINDNWGKSVNAVIANTEVKQGVKNLAHRNAYQMKLEREYNSGKSPRQPKQRLKMYAELTRIRKCKKQRIKSPCDNKLDYALLQPQQRFTDSDTAKGGFQNVMFNGVPFVVSAKCPSGHVFFLNEEFLYLYYHPKRNFVLDPFIKSTTQDLKIAKVFWMGNMGSSNNRMHGKMTAIAA